MLILSLTVGPDISYLFSPNIDAETLNYIRIYLIATCLGEAANVPKYLTRATLQGIDDKTAMIIAGIGEFVGRVLVCIIFANNFPHIATYFQLPVGWVFSLVILLIWWRHKHYTQIYTQQQLE